MTSLPRRPSRRHSFTLVEVLVATSILVILLAVLFAIINSVSQTLRQSTKTLEAFQSAREGFDTMTYTLGQATLNTYLDYDNSTTPTYYLRKSELGFTIGQAGSSGFPGTASSGTAVFFQAPVNYTTSPAQYGGLDSLFNTCGYYVAFTTNAPAPFYVAGTTYRYRLMQVLVPAESNLVYTASTNGWYAPSIVMPDAVPVADNIIALVIRAQDPGSTPPDLTTNYSYDSSLNATVIPQPITANQLPPVLQVTLVAIDEAAAKRLDTGTASPPAVITAALNGKFQSVANYQSDLDDLESKLTVAHVQYHVFYTDVPMRESKWTK